MRMKIRLGKLQFQSIEENKDQTAEYRNILQTKPTNIINRVGKSNIKENDITGVGSVKISGVEVYIDNCKENMISITTNRVFDLIMLKFTEVIPYGEKTPLEVIDEKREININLLEFMEKCGLKDKKEARKQLTTELETLYNTSLRWTETRAIAEKGRKRKVMSEMEYNTRIIDSIGIEKGKIINNNVATIKLNMDMAKYFTYTGYICPYNMNVLKLSAKTYANPIAKTLLELANINKNNPKRKFIVTVETILKRLDKIRVYESLKRKSGFSRRIIEPLEKAFEELIKENVLESWEYLKANGEKFTDEEMGFDADGDYTGEKEIFLKNSEDFLKLKILFKFKDYPETQDINKKTNNSDKTEEK